MITIANRGVYSGQDKIGVVSEDGKSWNCFNPAMQSRGDAAVLGKGGEMVRDAYLGSRDPRFKDDDKTETGELIFVKSSSDEIKEEIIKLGGKVEGEDLDRSALWQAYKNVLAKVKETMSK